VTSPARPKLSAQDGFSLIEALIGMAITISIATAMAVGLINNNQSALGTQRQAQLVAVLQDRTEWVRQLLRESYSSKGFDAVALSQNPEKGSDSTLPGDPADPNDYISNWTSGYATAEAGAKPEGLRIEKNYNNSNEGVIANVASEGETLEVDPVNGKVPPVSYVDLATGKSYSAAGEVPSGDSYAIVNTYVTLAKEVVTSSEASCPTTAGTGSNAGDARRVIVAARLVPPGGVVNGAKPQYATTLLTNPTPSNQCQAASGLRFGFNIE
jgi:type II secretory pathway pseudopilin PulG